VHILIQNSPSKIYYHKERIIGFFIARLLNETYRMIINVFLLKDLQAMTDAAGNRPVILINPRLKVFNEKLSL
jgi:hypothetical protein